MNGVRERVDRDMLELWVACGMVPEGTPRELAHVPDRVPADRPAVVGLVGRGPQAGQTTVLLGLALAWSALGRRVLLVDLDPSEELARLLLLGLAVTPDGGLTLLDALRAPRALEPRPTLLAHVDIVVSGTLNTYDPDALPALLRKSPHALGDVLARLAGRYDRVLVDCPPIPATLRRALGHAADAVISVGRSDDPTPMAGGSLTEGRAHRLGAVLTRWRPDGGPDTDWVEATWPAGAVDGDWFDTVVPDVPALRGPWDLVDGSAGPLVDEAFRRLAEEVDARLDRVLA